MATFDALAALLNCTIATVRPVLISINMAPVRTCGRCGGTGEHSYNPLDGRMCYGCGGTGKQSVVGEETVKRVAALREEYRCHCGGITQHADGCCDGAPINWVEAHRRVMALKAA